MHGVHVHLSDEMYMAESTNAIICVRVTGPTVGPADDYPVKSDPGSGDDCVIPAKAWGKHFKAAKKLTCRASPLLQSVPIVIHYDRATLGATDLAATLVETTPLCEGRFPDVSTIFDATPTSTLIVDAELLMQLLKVITPFCGGDTRVQIEMRGDKFGAVNDPVVIRVLEPELPGQVITAVIMPSR